jgi:hypothetical protein|nr:MAG TPA_asm: hypothetical protein [Caudoviricetes sp.]
MSDCSKTYNYFAEKNRMTKSTCEKRCNISCHECPLSRFNNGEKISCRDFEMLHTKQAIFLVQVWCAEHPPKTYLSEFLKNYPNAKLTESGVPDSICPYMLGLCDKHDCKCSCIECWNHSID